MNYLANFQVVIKLIKLVLRLAISLSPLTKYVPENKSYCNVGISMLVHISTIGTDNSLNLLLF